MSTRFIRLAAGTLLLSATAFTASTVLADDDEYGAYLYQGACDDIAAAAVVDDIGELERDNDDVAEHWQVLGGDNDTLPCELRAEDDDLDDDDVTLESILDGPHMIVVHAQEDSDSDPIVCGDITGEPDAEGVLMFDLQELRDSGFEGRAAFSSNLDDRSRDDDDIDVVIGLWPDGDVQPLGTPESTPVG